MFVRAKSLTRIFELNASENIHPSYEKFNAMEIFINNLG
jgi:hypothetical protein